MEALPGSRLGSLMLCVAGLIRRRVLCYPTLDRPLALPLRQDFEWTPNGHSCVWLDPANADIVGTSDSATQDVASAVTE